MKPLLISISPEEPMSQELCKMLDAENGKMTLRRFPDGESYVRIESECKSRDVLVMATLFKPDDKIIPLIFISETLKEFGAKSIGLVSPYLAYMRQDKRFHEGEGISSRYFSKLISNYFDWIVTVDPHLHRYHSLNEIYSIPNQVVHAAQVVSEWIHKNIDSPLLIGPDSESEQWVSDVAKRAGAPHIVLTKVRHGDHDVEVSVPEVEKWQNHTPVLVDDIISTGRTMIETIEHLKEAKMKAPICIGVHGVFSGDAFENLNNAGTRLIVTCNSIPHSSNQIDLSNLISDAVQKMMRS